MTKPAARVLSGDGFKDIVQRGTECVFGTSAGAAQERLELAPRLFDGIEVRRVRGQKKQSASGRFDQLSMSSRTRSALCTLRLSRHTTWPGCSVGVKTCSMKATIASVSAARFRLMQVHAGRHAAWRESAEECHPLPAPVRRRSSCALPFLERP